MRSLKPLSISVLINIERYNTTLSAYRKSIEAEYANNHNYNKRSDP